MSRNITFVVVAALLLPATFSRAQAESRVDQQSAQRRLMPIPGPHPGPGWVWVPPVYRSTYERVWREATYRTVTETVWVGDQWGWRTVCYWDGSGFVERQEWGLLAPGHYETRSRQVLVSPAGWTWVKRQELVTPGHWEWRGPGPMPPPQPDPWPTPHPPPPAPQYTAAPRPPGLEPFSPLWEWPAEKK